MGWSELTLRVEQDSVNLSLILVQSHSKMPNWPIFLLTIIAHGTGCVWPLWVLLVNGLVLWRIKVSCWRDGSASAARSKGTQAGSVSLASPLLSAQAPLQSACPENTLFHEVQSCHFPLKVMAFSLILNFTPFWYMTWPSVCHAERCPCAFLRTPTYSI